MNNDGKADQQLKLNSKKLWAIIAGAIVLIAVATAGVAYSMSKHVVISDNGASAEKTTFAGTVGELLNAEGYVLGEKDEVTPALEQSLANDTQIVITRAKPIVLDYATEIIELKTAKATVGEMLAQEGREVGENDLVEPAAAEPITEGMTVKVTKVSIETVKEQTSIPFETTKKKNNDLKPGETKVITEGVDGIKENTYTVKTVNGVQESKELAGSETIKEPVNKVVEYAEEKKAEAPAARSTGGTTSRGNIRYKKVLNVTATAYELLFGSKNGKPGKTASGRTLSLGMIAVDPRVIPLGTRVYVESPDGKYVYGEAVAADTGSGIVGNRIDICLATYRECINFGVRPMKVYILE